MSVSSRPDHFSIFTLASSWGVGNRKELNKVFIYERILNDGEKVTQRVIWIFYLLLNLNEGKKTISIWIPFSIRFSNWIVLNFFPDDGFEIINHDDLNNKFRRILPIFISESIFYQDFVFSESILSKRYWNDLLGGHFKFCRSF